MTKMNIYLLTSTTKSLNYDVVQSMVVRAENETQARLLASQKAMDEGEHTWLKDQHSYCERINRPGEAQVMCVDAING